MKRILVFLALTSLLGAVGSCAEPKPRGKSMAAAMSGRFEAVGRVTLHPGQPCAPQIMFDFDMGFGQRIWLAAGAKETSVLTSAAQHHRRVHVSGTWRHGKDKDCRYVSVATISS